MTRYVVMQGDSFSSIAQQVYGDSSYASLLAEANGLRVDETPQPDSGFWGSFLGIVVQVVITVAIAYIMPALIPALAQVQGAAVMTNVLRAAALGALTSAATQGVLIGLGAQHQFSFGNMAFSAASAGLNVGLDVQGLDKLKPGEKLELAEKLSRIGKVVVLEQLSKLALGLSSHFDFGEVLAALSGQLVNHELNITHDLIQPLSQPLVQGMVDSVVQSHRPNVELIMV